MKLTTALAVLFLVCRAQARSVESDGKDQLKVLVDHLEDTMKPSLTETRQQVNKIKTDMIKGKETVVKNRDKLVSEFLAQGFLSSTKDKILLAAASMSNDTSSCMSKSYAITLEIAYSKNVLRYCVDAALPNHLKPVNEVLQTIDKTILNVDVYVKAVKRCLDDAECLKDAKDAIDELERKAQGQVNLWKLRDQHHKLLKDLAACEKQTAFDVLIAQFRAAEDDVRKCLVKLIPV
ncbi:hypothetical protein TKK_0003433 [Trichogramma kaykai]|uniref:Uncharacterized protein n=1 Tax=Trichogramma kaykai TaxID=54128 RepID=A0ABD2XRY5_9HYME